MASNDHILIDGIVDDRLARGIPSDMRSEVFEYFAFEQLLKDADLSEEELKSGMIDGRDDGGLDGVFIIVNGHLLLDPAAFAWPKAGVEIEIWVLTCKLHNTFKQAPLDLLVASLAELLELGTPADRLQGAYSPEVLRLRGLLLLAYRRLAPHLRSFRMRVVYVSRGDSAMIGDSVRARANQLVALVEGLFGGIEVSFQFVGSAELVRLHRRVRKFSLELPFLECLARGERYVLLTTLTEYAQFATDENGTPRRYLFDSNVRDYMGLNQVNEDILATLRAPGSADFWWLNNGVTLLASGAAVTGKSIQIQDVQIVNGLQTTESVTQFFLEGGKDPDSRVILVKVIVTTDPEVRDAIIRATNNQTAVETASLRATESRQRDIEDVLQRHGLFYERRKNYHLNLGCPHEAIVSPLYAAAAVVTLILKSPTVATTLKQRFMRNTASYEAVFDSDLPLEAWPKAVMVLRATDAFLMSGGVARKRPGERFLRNWRQVTALLAVARATGTFAFDAANLAQFEGGRLTKELFSEVWQVIDVNRHSRKTKPPKKRLIRRIVVEAAVRFEIKANRAVEARHPFSHPTRLDDEFINAVDAALPDQPWKPGVHRQVAAQLHCSARRVSEAIESLMIAGRRHTQKDGIVFSDDGEVIAFDAERVSAKEVHEARSDR